MDQSSEPLVSIQEIARRTGVAASALRYYERLDLIRSERQCGGHRRYRQSTLRRVEYLTLAQRAGFTLEEIAEHLALLPIDQSPAKKDWEQLKPKWMTRIDQRLAELQQLKIDMERCTGECGS
ncbi:MerR family transcriptional regulator [Methylovirgula sp. 4M-Z18]|uniref:MerR family transcriptional regulator n=1 Tax=Methylovirgula sp. 4M-Z18 TaxID=2293567 RepID=UPI000E2E7D4F|nr:MerR family transcriptional regulator [Methylovirgula sp. 4M-Z18]RFB79764.1 MerR family transcriptional regulator [Methylovirgula sp. 4M-Z18]